MMRKATEAGQAMVEYALLAALFFTLVFFIMDGSQVLWGYVATSHLSAIGARYAIVHGAQAEPPSARVGPTGYDALRKVVLERARGLDPDQISTVAKWEDDSNSPGKLVTVEVSYRARSVTGLFWGGRTLTVRGQTSMIIQN